MRCHIIGCENEATKVITKKNGLHDSDLPVCNKCAKENTNEDEVVYDIK